MKTKNKYYPKLKDVKKAAENLNGISAITPLKKNKNLSNQYDANIFLKREDLQEVRSYKIRGAYNKIISLSKNQTKNGVVCASAGNHAQGVAYCCCKLKIEGVIFMPLPTSNQKIQQVKMFGGRFIKIILFGDTFDDAFNEAKVYSNENNSSFVHPFDDEKIIEGQGTVGLEIIEQSLETIDYLFVPVGGGGLASGVSYIFKLLSPNSKIIGVEPEGAPSMSVSLSRGKITSLKSIEKFVDGAAVKRVGDRNFELCKELLDDMITIPEGKVCDTILELYNKDAIVVEPAGALTISALDIYSKEIRKKNVVCVVSGGNNDITRMEEIKERAMLHKQLKHYFLVKFVQKSGSLREFLNKVLGPNDDITFFEYHKKQNREKGSAIVGIVLNSSKDLQPLIERMKKLGFYGDYLNLKPDFLELLT